MSRLLLSLVVFVLAAAVAEVMLRSHLESKDLARGELAWDTPPWAPPWMEPGEASLRWRFSPGGDRNSLGLRDREVRPKGPGEHRVLFLGDSLLYFSATTESTLFPDLVEQGLSQRLSDRFESVDVVNAGVPGYTTFQELEFLKLHGLSMEPDRVVLAFVLNDVHYPYLHLPRHDTDLVLDPATRLQRFGTLRLPGRLLRSSHLAHEGMRVLDQLWGEATGRPHFEFAEMGDQWLAWKRHPWRRTEVLLQEMRDLLAEREIPLHVLVFPVREQMDSRKLAEHRDYLLYPQAQLLEITERLEVDSLDLRPVLAAGGGAALFSDYVHLNAEGNDLIAGEVERWLADLIERELERR